MLGKGTWWIKSKSNSKWDASGYGYVGMFGMPRDAEIEIKLKKEEFQEDPPNDLECGYMKD